MANLDERFVYTRLDALTDPPGFVPSVAEARFRLQARVHAARQRRMWKAAVAATGILMFIALPAARAVAQGGELSLESLAQSFHHMLRDVHEIIYHHYWTIRDWLGW
jgi:hypothetical protein